MNQFLFCLAGCWLLVPSAFAWDYESHRLVNQLALASLPKDFPAFALTSAAKERIAFLAGEADRWRNSNEDPFKNASSPDHYFDMDDLALFGLKPETISPFRYDFSAQLASARALHPTNFPPIEAAKDHDHTRALLGFLPWAINENYAKLKSEFSYLKAFEELGTAEEIANARLNIVYTMGVMGHFVGDATQPLHTTKHHHGWVGENPDHYATNFTFHAWIDGGFIRRTGIKTETLLPKVRPARSLWTNAVTEVRPGSFSVILNFVSEQHQLVGPLYQLEKEHKLSPNNAGVSEGQKFISAQLLKAGQMLGDLWWSAWREASPDKYLHNELLKRKAAADAASGNSPTR